MASTRSLTLWKRLLLRRGCRAAHRPLPLGDLRVVFFASTINYVDRQVIGISKRTCEQ